RQAPGRRVLQCICQHPKVNPGWLISGEGSPLLASDPEGPSRGWPIPIAKRLLPGPVDKFSEYLSPEVFPVAGAFFGATRYAYCVAEDDPVVNIPWLKIATGDWLLVETDRHAWQEASQLEGRFVTVSA